MVSEVTACGEVVLEQVAADKGYLYTFDEGMMGHHRYEVERIAVKAIEAANKRNKSTESLN
jgi:hypothetical protein